MQTRPPDDISVIDPTGCGDVYLSTFMYTNIRTNNIQKAAKMANLIAALSGTFTGLPAIDDLRMKRLER